VGAKEICEFSKHGPLILWLIVVGGVAQWFRRRPLAGRLSLTYA